MMPEVLFGRLANPPLEDLRVGGHDAVDVCLAITRLGDVDRLEAQLIASRGLSQRDAEHDRGAEAGGEDCRTTRRFRESPEERPPCRGKSDCTLVEEKGDGAAAAERTRDASHRLLVVHDRHTNSL